jgi:DNA-binding transcriptional MerR regulator
MSDRQMTITEVAEKIGVPPRTIKRWEESGKVPKPRRDWRDRRVYLLADLEALTRFKEI